MFEEFITFNLLLIVLYILGVCKIMYNIIRTEHFIYRYSKTLIKCYRMFGCDQLEITIMLAVKCRGYIFLNMRLHCSVVYIKSHKH